MDTVTHCEIFCQYVMVWCQISTRIWHKTTVAHWKSFQQRLQELPWSNYDIVRSTRAMTVIQQQKCIYFQFSIDFNLGASMGVGDVLRGKENPPHLAGT